MAHSHFFALFLKVYFTLSTQVSCIASRFFTIWLGAYFNQIYPDFSPGLQRLQRWQTQHIWDPQILITLTLFPGWSSSVSSATQLCPTLCDPMNHSMPGLPVHHQLPESTQTQVHWVGDAIQPSHPLSSPFPPALNLSQHQGLFTWVSFSYQVAKVACHKRKTETRMIFFFAIAEAPRAALFPPNHTNCFV